MTRSNLNAIRADAIQYKPALELKVLALPMGISIASYLVMGALWQAGMALLLAIPVTIAGLVLALWWAAQFGAQPTATDQRAWRTFRR